MTRIVTVTPSVTIARQAATLVTISAIAEDVARTLEMTAAAAQVHDLYGFAETIDAQVAVLRGMSALARGKR